MNADAFRLALPDQVREHLPAELHRFRHATRFAYVQFWYGEPAFHFEVWAQPRYNVIEVGLHFEHKESARNAALHRFFDGRLVEICDLLGEMWLEQWDKGWHKLYRTVPLEPYTEPLLDSVAREVARQIIVLQPMLHEGVAAFTSETSARARSARRAPRG
jgi:hypothetical protein